METVRTCNLTHTPLIHLSLQPEDNTASSRKQDHQLSELHLKRYSKRGPY